MKLLICLMLVGSHLLADATVLPNRNNDQEKEDPCIAKIGNIGQQGDNFLVLYTPNTCGNNAKDVISYYYKGFEYIIKHVEGVPGVVLIPDLQLSCLTIEVTIITYVEADDKYIEEIGRDVKAYETRLVAVTGLMIKSNPEQNNKISVSWDVQPYAEECALRYVVTYDDDEILSCETPTDCFIEGDEMEIPMCEEVEIFVTPQKGNLETETASAYFTRPIDSVTDFGAEHNINLGFVTCFTPLVDTRSECGDVSYTVTQVDGDCFSSYISVQVVPKDTPSATGQTVPKKFKRGPGRVINLDHKLIDGQVYLTWDAPEDGEDCLLVYIVTYHEGLEEKIISTDSTSAQVPNLATVCTAAGITIKASNDIDGPERTLNVEGEFGRVKDLVCQLGSGAARCDWKAPDNTDDCDLVEYKVTYSDGARVREEKTSQMTFAYVANCGHVWIQITPLSGGRSGILWDFVFADVPECSSTLKSWWNYLALI